MSKRQNQTEQILRKAMMETTHAEFKVFSDWFLDDISYNATHEKIAERTGLDTTSVSKRIKSLIKKNLIKEVSRYKRSQNYKLGSFFSDDIKSLPIKEVPVEVSLTKVDKIINKCLSEVEGQELRKEVMKDIVLTLHTNNIPEDEVESSIRKLKRSNEEKINNVKSKSQGQKQAWINDLNQALDGEFASLYSDDINFDLPEKNEDGELVNGQYGSMSREEYKRQRVYAEQYRVLDWTKLSNSKIVDLDEFDLENI